MLEIYVKPDRVWDYFHANRGILENDCRIIAEFEDAESNRSFKVYIAEEFGHPRLTIESEGKPLAIEYAISKEDCVSVVQALYESIGLFASLARFIWGC